MKFLFLPSKREQQCRNKSGMNKNEENAQPERIESKLKKARREKQKKKLRKRWIHKKDKCLRFKKMGWNSVERALFEVLTGALLFVDGVFFFVIVCHCSMFSASYCCCLHYFFFSSTFRSICARGAEDYIDVRVSRHNKCEM